jgi:hypothetical protein
VVLSSEVPDPSRIPPGCRFHPRCPALADGSADAAGVSEACRTVPLDVLSATGPHRAACHLDSVVSATSGAPAGGLSTR